MKIAFRLTRSKLSKYNPHLLWLILFVIAAVPSQARAGAEPPAIADRIGTLRYRAIRAGVNPVSAGSLAQTVARTINEQTKLLPDESAANFGYAVSISGKRALIGTFGNDLATGAAYIFTFDGTAWTQTAKLTASDGKKDAHFGYAVSLDGDRALIGAWGADTFNGAAYVFAFDGTSWSQEAKLVAADGVRDDFFGFQVALHGDRALIGANGVNGFTGAAYIFVSDGASWTQETKLIPADAAVGDSFGTGASLSGRRALIGSPYNAPAGAAYVYVFDGASWTEEAKLVAADGLAGDGFASFAVALSGPHAIVGAFTANAGVGAAYIYAYDGTGWSQEAKLTPSDNVAGGSFGTSVAIDGRRALVGAFEVGNGGPGSAYLFGFNNTAWKERAKLLASDGEGGDTFGISVSLSGAHALVGAFFDFGGGIAGSAYLFGP